MNRSRYQTIIPLHAFAWTAALLLIAVAGCTDLKTDLPPPTGAAVKVHPSGWNDTAQANFHGKVLKAENWDLTSCEPCHGKSFTGGVSNTSCYKCHSSFPHPDLWDTTFAGYHTSTQFHGTFLRVNGWKLTACQSCHGSSFTGGSVVDVSCTSAGCHVDGTGAAKPPTACNTCHGNFRGAAGDTLSWAPPRSVAGDTLESAPGVGAHQAHVAEGAFASLIPCKECHVLPAAYTDPGHIDSTGRAKLVFNSDLAAMPTAGGSYIPDPSYDYATHTCQSVYCHGNWKLQKSSSNYAFAYTDSVMTGAKFSPVWTEGSTQDSCGSCHGIPPAGHISRTLAQCGNCHTGEVDAAGNITDRTLHMNGKVDVFGTERDF